MDNYQHELFFNTETPIDGEKQKIRLYFQKRRISGGGDCGIIENVGENIYKICFKEKEDQEKVLQRKVHTISLPSGEVCLTVHSTCPQNNPKPMDQPSSSQTQKIMEPSVKSREKIFHIDLFLLYYLRDSLKAHKIMQKQLYSVGCTIQLNVEDEEVVVREDVGQGSRGDFGISEELWQVQVDRVINEFKESYLFYHVLEPEKEKLIMQDPSFATDVIKVYNKDGYPVIVGETETVMRKIAILESSRPNRKECPVLEKQFHLIEEVFSQEMRTHCPQVQILRTRSDMIILEGPDTEAESGARKLHELLKNVKEKRIKLPTAMQYFITASGAFYKYENCFRQCFRRPVSLMLDSDLVLSSLSSEALDEATKIMQRDISVATLQLQGAAAVPPELDRLKEILNKAKNNANATELRVDVRYTAGPAETAKAEVHLVGYSENVNQLKDLLYDYQMNQVEAQEVLNLPLPQMVDYFDKFLALIGMNQPKVTLKPSHFPYPCVLVSGPRRLVQETQQGLNAALAKVTSDTLVLDGPWAQQYFQEKGKMGKDLVERSCQVLILKKESVPTVQKASNVAPSTSTTRWQQHTFNRSSSAASVVNVAANKISLEIKLGSVVDEQVDVLVAPMLNKKLASTKIGKCLLKKSSAIDAKLNSVAKKCHLAPGDVLALGGPLSLSCSKIFFINCLSWDGAKGLSVQALGDGLKKCLDLCGQQGWISVAFPVIGPGKALKFPLTEAVRVLNEKISQFASSGDLGSVSTIRIIIKEDYPNSEECYREVNRHFSLNQQSKAIFKSITGDLDEITMTVGGGVKLQLVFGDISNQTTDVVVNTTNFSDFNTGVCKAILAKAGPAVEAALKAAKVNVGEILVSAPGRFPCKSIFHVNGEQNAVAIKQLVQDIIQRCETHRLKSVAIPAICTGAGELQPPVVADAILRAIHASTFSSTLRSVRCLSNIRLVLSQINIFRAFKEKAMQIFPSAVITAASAPQLPLTQHHQPPPPVDLDLSILRSRSPLQQSSFLILGRCRKDVDNAMTQLKQLHQSNFSTETFRNDDFAGFSQDDVNNVAQMMTTLGLHVKREQSSQGGWTVSGFKDEVNQVRQKIDAKVRTILKEKVRGKKEEELYNLVAWCIHAPCDNWERLPRTANHNLEIGDVVGGIVDGQGIQWTVDLQRMEAQSVGQTRKLKRLQNLPDFPLPLYWDNMSAGKHSDVVLLQLSSAEYCTVKGDFAKTVAQHVIKIERLQNVHLRRAYEVQKKRIADKNGHLRGGVEKFLFHGTNRENCNSIMATGFNRRYAGQNGTAYGFGTYFAVHASYSARPAYAKPAPDGTQLMFVVRVLTGSYTQGQSNMNVPPPRNTQQSHDLFDSVVDNLDNPAMYVVFHDDQAYPDYLITFK